jgi:ubiquinone/menaquinone biosynthesis C-methylase UbiE
MTTEATRASYDQIAARYAKVNAAMPPELADAAARFLELIGREALVLDLGCGAGRDVAWLAARGAQVVGCDISQGMLAQARAVACSPLQQMDMRRLGYPSDRFKGIWCCASLLHLPKNEALLALSEVRRVLVPGGVLFLSVQEGTGEGWERCSYAPVERWFARCSQHDMVDLMTQSGLSVIETWATEGRLHPWLQFLARATK